MVEKSGFSHRLRYKPNNSKRDGIKRNRRRNIIWFNPPHSKSVVTNVAKYFLKLIDKHFPNHHRFKKLFNRNTVKVSYSCTSSIKVKINQHNREVLCKKEITTLIERSCNCVNEEKCPLNGKDIIYIANITSDLRNYKMKEYKVISATTDSATMRRLLTIKAIN